MLRVFLRGWLLVALVSSNTIALARGNVPLSLVGGFLISLTWWHNAHSAAHVEGKAAGLVYACGATAGTATGLLIGWLTG